MVFWTTVFHQVLSLRWLSVSSAFLWSTGVSLWTATTKLTTITWSLRTPMSTQLLIRKVWISHPNIWGIFNYFHNITLPIFYTMLSLYCSKYVRAHYDPWPADEQDPIVQLSLPTHEERNSQRNHSKVCLNFTGFYSIMTHCCLSICELTIRNICSVSRFASRSRAPVGVPRQGHFFASPLLK